MTSTSRRWLLRDRTAEAHAALDAAIGGLDDLSTYRAYLKALAAFRAPIEQQLSTCAWPDTLGTWRPNSVSAALAEDMEDLGVALGPSAASPLRLDGARLYGTLYVLEGSALGAQLLFRRAQVLGLSESYGARHLALLGGSIQSWRGFLERLEEAEPFDLDGAVEASVAAFALAHAAFVTR
jgi:heme oxygenase